MWFVLAGIILCTVFILLLRDIKAIIAYRRIIHMNIVVLLFVISFITSKSLIIIIIVVHGFTRGLIFIINGFIYYFILSRNIYYICVGIKLYSLATLIFIISLLINIGAPPFMAFIIEINIFLLSLRYRSFLFLYLIIYFLLITYFAVFVVIGATTNMYSSMIIVIQPKQVYIRLILIIYGVNIRFFSLCCLFNYHDIVEFFKLISILPSK